MLNMHFQHPCVTWTLLSYCLRFLDTWCPVRVIKCHRENTEGHGLLFMRHHININAFMRHLMMKSPPIPSSVIFPIDPEESYEGGKAGHSPMLQMKSSD